ncbi:hypothetical protein NXW09_29545 [Bacteroides ovatus]|nr:hypothetical protein [Bacteroides ovatus]
MLFHHAQVCTITFFNAQQKKDDEHPYGIEEGDETSLRLKNTAYGFASAIAGAVTGEGGSGSGGLLLDYLKKSGGDMTGKAQCQLRFRSRHWKHPYPGNLFAGHYRSGRCGNCHRVRYQDYRQPESRGRQPAYRRQAVAPLRRGQGHRYNQRFPYRLSGCDGTFQRGMDYRGTRIQEYPSPRHGWPWAGRMSIIVATPIRTRWIGRCGTAW